MANFRPVPGLRAYSGGTVPGLHRIVYSPREPRRQAGHFGFFTMILSFALFVKASYAQANMGLSTKLLTGVEKSNGCAGNGMHRNALECTGIHRNAPECKKCTGMTLILVLIFVFMLLFIFMLILIIMGNSLPRGGHAAGQCPLMRGSSDG